ncbi:MAG: protein-export chaperone SecB [Gammaproteobacteria bacterium]|jgi:preprotein translocase subunit SecB
MASEPLLRQVLIKKLYLKSLALQTHEDRSDFGADVDAERKLNIRTTSSELDGDEVEVTLNVGVKAVAQDDTLYTVEVAQAGVFEIRGYTERERIQILGHVCPEILFPYARSVITAAVRRGGFQDVGLRPLDFRALFAQDMQNRAAQAAAG